METDEPIIRARDLMERNLSAVTLDAEPEPAPSQTATVGPDATVAEIANTMLEHHVHRVLVCEGRVLLGVVSAFDLMRVLTQLPPLESHAGPVRHTGYSR